MAALPEAVRQAWDDREGPVVLTTVDTDGLPNSIYATCVGRFSEVQWVVADNYFQKTRANLLSGSRGSILFMTKEGKAFQSKGTLEYHKTGEIYDHMKGWLDPKFPGHAAAVLNVEEVYSGAEKLF